ncbi:hydroxymethylpyrimidine/phosphomethylpyrimidine kinase [Fibrobacter sp.]|uniref:hydroxymethylpyrimidine/phosphomethylpyrimidine kinase n=1 Tax=Fibrobacter sp. TaxID=35828 RepID=UPI0038905504
MIYALTIAGFDGSAGAGVLADVKAMAHFGVYGEAVCTALTEQNEDEFVAPGWVPWERIHAQLELLFKKRNFQFVKIGLVENAEMLKRVVDFVRAASPDSFIVWDPIASATAGFNFMQASERAEFLQIMKRIDLVTPNQDEYEFLGLETAGGVVANGAAAAGRDFAMLLKGGHATGAEAVDVLYCRDGSRHEFSTPRLPGKGKHGTGCNLSSAILANVALGETLPEACSEAKKYLQVLLQSGEGRLGFVK